MDTGAALRVSRVLLTGAPGIGKTTICKKLVSTLKEEKYKFDGFYTEEIRDKCGNRIGFDVVLVQKPEEKSRLARAQEVINLSQYSKYKVGKYHVFLDDFETAVLPVLHSTEDVLIVDEIGKMELFSQKFQDKVEELFFSGSSKPFIIATIPEMHKVPQKYLPLFEKLHRDKHCKVLTVNRKNRNNLPNEIVKFLMQGP